MPLIPINSFQDSKLKTSDYTNLYCLPSLYSLIIPEDVMYVMQSQNPDQYKSFSKLVTQAKACVQRARNMRLHDKHYGASYEDDVMSAYEDVRQVVGWFTTDIKVYDKLLDRGHDINYRFPNGDKLELAFLQKLAYRRNLRNGRRRDQEFDYFGSI